MKRSPRLESDKVVRDRDSLSGEVAEARALELGLLPLVREAAGEADQPRDPSGAGPGHQVLAQSGRAGRQQPRPHLEDGEPGLGAVIQLHRAAQTATVLENKNQKIIYYDL